MPKFKPCRRSWLQRIPHRDLICAAFLMSMMKSSVKPCMFKNPANPLVDGGPDEDEKSYFSEFDVNKIEESAGSINDSNNGQHDRTDDMV